MTLTTSTEILQQIANLKQRNMLKLEEIAENMEAIQILSLKLVEMHTQEMAERKSNLQDKPQ